MEKKVIASAAIAAVLIAGGIGGGMLAQTLTVGANLTQDQAIAIARNETSGEVQAIDLEREGLRRVFEITLLTEAGRQMEVEIAADTGDVLEVREEREGCDKGQDI